MDHLLDLTMEALAYIDIDLTNWYMHKRENFVCSYIIFVVQIST
jgi:hypothetical protein